MNYDHIRFGCFVCIIYRINEIVQLLSICDRLFGIFRDNNRCSKQEKKSAYTKFVPSKTNLKFRYCVDRHFRCDKLIFRSDLNISLGFQWVFDVLRIECLKSFPKNASKWALRNLNIATIQWHTATNEIQEFKSRTNWICNWFYKMSVFMIIAF